MATKFVRIDNCAFTKNGSLLVSAKAAADIENGTFVQVKDLVAGEREICAYDTSIAEDATLVGIVCTPEVEYDESGYKGIDTFVNKEGDTIRIGLLSKGDMFSIGGISATDDIKSGTITAEYQKTETSGKLTYQVFRVV